VNCTAAPAPLARQRRAPLSATLEAVRPRVPRSRIGMAATDDFQPTWFAPAAGHERAFAPTQFVERRRFPRQPHASIGRLLEQSALPQGASVPTTSGTRTMPCMSATPTPGGFAFAGGSAIGPRPPTRPLMPRPSHLPHVAMHAMGDDSGFGRDGLEPHAAPGLRGIVARVERALDRLLPSPLGTLLGLFVCISLAMAVMSTLLPLIDLR